MTESEAYKKIERWLLVPINYESIVPALAAIRKSSDFSSYAEKVAQVEYKSISDVVLDVDAWIDVHKNDRTREEILQEKMDAIAGRSSGKVSNTNGKGDLNQQFGSFVQEYSSVGRNSGQDTSECSDLEHCCPHCGRPMILKEEYGRLTAGGVLTMVILFFFMSFLCIIPYMLGVGRERKRVYWCKYHNIKRDAF